MQIKLIGLSNSLTYDLKIHRVCGGRYCIYLALIRSFVGKPGSGKKKNSCPEICEASSVQEIVFKYLAPDVKYT